MAIIKSFDQVLDQIVPNTLVLCDLDNTLLDYGTRCAIQSDRQIKKCQNNSGCIYSLVPTLTDPKGFATLCDYVESTNSQLIFLTSRPRSQQLPTRRILSHYKLSNYLVLYAGSKSKGEYLIENLSQISLFDKIIFIDDLEVNLNSVVDSIKRSNILVPILTYKYSITYK
jgi:hypothetical protein